MGYMAGEGNEIIFDRKENRTESRKGKVLIIASVASMIDQFNIPNIQLLISMGYQPDVACNFKKGSTCSNEKIKELLGFLEQLHVDCYQIDFERTPYAVGTAFRAYWQLESVMKGTARTVSGKRFHNAGEPYGFIHAHSPVGGMLGRIAAKQNHARSVYTAHGFHFYSGAPLKNWLLYYPAEWVFSWITDVLVTINREDYIRAVKKLHAKKTVYIPGIGVDTEKFAVMKMKTEAKRRELGLRKNDILLLSAGELNENKNHAAVIRALALLKGESFFARLQYFVCGTGTARQKRELEVLVQRLGISGHVRLMGFRKDIAEIYGCADIFIHPSIREGLPAALMEAMSAGLAVICSDIRGNTDLIKNRVNGLICTMEKDETAGLIKKLVCDERLRKYLGTNAAWDIRRFDISRVNFYMKELYGKIGKVSQAGSNHETGFMNGYGDKEMKIHENCLVSVIIACYNAAGCLDACLKSLAAQTYQNIEIIICDDCSTDKSLEKLKNWERRDSRIMVLHNKQHLYAAETRNRCIAKSSGELIMIQDIDDISRPDRVERLIKAFRQETADFISSAMGAFDKNPSRPFQIMRQKKEYPEKTDFMWNLPFFHPASIFTRACILDVCGYRDAEETRRGQDYDMFMRLYAKGYHGRNIRDVLYLYRMDHANIRRRTLQARIGEYKIRKRGFQELGLMPWAFPFLFKPFAAHAVQMVKYAAFRGSR